MTKSSEINTGLILREQPDKGQAVAVIAKLLSKIATLWQIPNWSAENSVILADWTYENYSYEPMEVIIEALKNPPVTDEKTWRLTPEVIAKWMTAQLEKESVKRETELQKFKDQFKEKLPDVDYESFKKRLEEGTALPDDKKKRGWKDDAEYQKFSQEQHRKWRQNLIGKVDQGTNASAEKT